RHGVIKYDAGDTVLALNIADEKFDSQGSDGILTVFGASPMEEAKTYARMHFNNYPPPIDRAVFTDFDNHQYAIVQTLTTRTETSDKLFLQELRYNEADFRAAEFFFENQLGLIPLEKNDRMMSFATANVTLAVCLKKDAPPARKDSFLTVFHTRDIKKKFQELEDRGLKFEGPVTYSDIGGTARFWSPGNHCFCLYEPSTESLSWGSGEKVKSIIEGETNTCFWQTYDNAS
ncbi:MAG TPA: VOC family protein, partial [Pyrinomonadaceae bacterium]|nr:VOC family protein [Pyrinomonadaceae bacterium]